MPMLQADSSLRQKKTFQSFSKPASEFRHAASQSADKHRPPLPVSLYPQTKYRVPGSRLCTTGALVLPAIQLNRLLYQRLFKSQIIQIQINICISHQDITKYNIKNTKNSNVTGIQIKKCKILTKRIQISYNTNLYLPTPTTAPKRINIRKIPTNPKY